jgi:uncharacterized RDD family membrane protein YckC
LRIDRALSFWRSPDPILIFAVALCCHGIAMSEREFDYEAMKESSAGEVSPLLPLSASADATSPDWREEIATRMQQYRSRRKSRGPKYPSLQLPFERAEFSRAVEPASRSSLAVERAFDRVFDRADSLEEARIDRHAAAPAEVPVALSPAQFPDEPLFFQDLRMEPAPPVESARPAAATTATNLIEFPRYGDPVDLEELAEPIFDRPRILEVPDLVPPRPALGGILLEPVAEPEASANPEEQLRPASMGRRLFATVFDILFVLLATALGGWMCVQWTQEVPPQPQLLMTAVAATVFFWLGYQYLLLVLAGATLGQRLCKLELVTLEGSAPKMAQRRWRWLSSLLSAASMMLGYAWAFLDEKNLCWHDRISRTYLRRMS